MFTSTCLLKKLKIGYFDKRKTNLWRFFRQFQPISTFKTIHCFSRHQNKAQNSKGKFNIDRNISITSRHPLKVVRYNAIPILLTICLFKQILMWRQCFLIYVALIKVGSQGISESKIIKGRLLLVTYYKGHYNAQ